MYNYCTFDFDLDQYLSKFMEMFLFKDLDCSQQRMFQIVQSQSNYVEVAVNLYEIYKEADGWEPSFDTGYHIFSSGAGILVILEKAYETYQLA